MSLVSIMHSWFSGRRRWQRKRVPYVRNRVSLECLEDRTVFSTGLTRLPMPSGPPTVAPPAGLDLHGPQFVEGLYFDLLHRQPQSTEVAGWAETISPGAASRRGVIAGFLGSNEYRASEITSNYRVFLGRNPEAGAVDTWLSAMASGLNGQQLVAKFLASDEYYLNHGGTATSWLTGLYHDLFGRGPDIDGFTHWNASLGSGASREGVALGFVYSAEESARLVAQVYQNVLGRPVDSTGAAYWTAALSQGMTAEQLVEGIAASEEYYEQQLGVDFSSPVEQENGGTTTGTGNQQGDGGNPNAGESGGMDGNSGTQGQGSRTDGQGPIDSTGATDGGGIFGGGFGSGGLTGSGGRGGSGTGSNGGGQMGGGSGGQTGDGQAGGGQSGGGQTGGGQTGGGGPTGGQTGGGQSGGGQNGGQTTGGQSGSVGGTRVQTGGSLPSITVGPNVDTNREFGNQSEVAVAINPTNTRQMAVFANENDFSGSGMMFSFSTDGGTTWNPRVIGDGNDGLSLARTDPSLSWDQFGNLFITYIESTDSFVILCISTDGGQHIQELTSFPIPSLATPGLDQETVTTGAGSVWVDWADASTSIEATGARVTGLGQVGAFSTQVVPNSVGQDFGDIAVGPNGQVATAFQSLATQAGPDTILFSLNPNGVGGTFQPAAAAISVNVGGHRAIPAQPVRTIDAEVGLAYDRSNGPHRGRLYMVYTDAVDTTTDDTNIFLIHSDQDGAPGSWSAPLKINDDNTSLSQFFSKIAVDQSTGNLIISWYDCRNDNGSGPGDTDGIGNDDVEVFAAVSFDGGQSVTPNFQVASGPSTVTINPNNGNDFGDYMGLDFARGIAVPGWTDNNPLIFTNPEAVTFDIMTAVITVTGPGGGGGSGGGGGGGFVQLPDDRFEPNDTSDRPTNFGVLMGQQAETGLTISLHPNGLFDNDWYRWTAGAPGTFDVKINYQSPTGGDLNMRVYTLDSLHRLVQIASSRQRGVTSQEVSVRVLQGEPLFVWVYGFNHAQGNYDLTATLS
jgi:hypothetical protein